MRAAQGPTPQMVSTAARSQGASIMGYQFDTARAAIDERLREAEQYRIAREVRRGDRARRGIKRRFLTNGNA